MNENELLEYQNMLDMINSYNKKTEARNERSVPADTSEGPLPLPTPSLPPENVPASPDEGPLPLPTPTVPSRPSRPVIPIIPIPPRPQPQPPWIDIKPSESCKGACLPIAYPKVEVRNKDEGTACIIYELFAGEASALTAFLTYTYDGAYFYDERNNAGRIFSGIASCKENHLRLLALLLAKLGVMPKYHSCQRGNYTWWDAGSDIKYPAYLKMALLDAVDLETKSIENYENAAAEVRDPYISTLLRRILMDIKYHLELITELYNSCCK